MSDVLDEDILTTAQAARYLSDRVRGARFSPTVVWRWIANGLLDASGRRVVLESGRIGRRLVTSRQAMLRFSARLSNRIVDVAPAMDAVADAARASLAEDGFYAAGGVRGVLAVRGVHGRDHSIPRKA